MRWTRAAVLAALFLSASAQADILFNTDITNTTGNVVNDYHVKLKASEPINIDNTYETGGAVVFPDALSGGGVSGNGTNSVTIDWTGATVNPGQDTHLGASTGIGGGTPNDLVICESWWTFGGVKVVPNVASQCSADFDGQSGSGDWTVVRIEIFDDLAGNNLIATQWVEGRGETATITNQTSDGPIFARWAFRPPDPVQVPIDALNSSLGGFGPAGPITVLPPRGTFTEPCPAINEIYASHSGLDNLEFIELSAQGGTPLTGIVIMVVEGDASSSCVGCVDGAWDLSAFVMPADGFFVLGNSAVANLDLDIGLDNILENGTETFYLVRSPNPAALVALVGSDVDPDGDLQTTIPTMGSVLDIIAMIDDPADLVYDGAGTVGPDGTFLPAGIYRGSDTPNSWCSQAFLDFDPFANANQPRTPGAINWVCTSETTSYCTAGISAAGCRPALWSAGIASSSAPSGFHLMVSWVEGQKDGLFFFGTNGAQANPWGNGTSLQCVKPPVKRGGLLTGVGTNGVCDGRFSQDLNARWTAKPSQNPGMGATVKAQFWYRDPLNPSNQTTSLSNAVSFTVQ